MRMARRVYAGPGLLATVAERIAFDAVYTLQKAGLDRSPSGCGGSSGGGRS